MKSNEIEVVFKATPNLIIQEIYQPDENKYRFAVYNDKEVTFKEDITIDGKTYVPIKSALIEKQLVLFPSGTEEYYSVTDLIKDIKAFIHKYYEYPKLYEEFDAYYVLNTWNYDKFSVTPYRRILGDYGSGKTRFLKVIGNISYLPIFTSSASSEASLYRTIDIFHGTVIIDEADFINSNLYSTIIKILNCGYQKGTPVVKCELTEFKPEAFDVFCPKVIGSRRRYDDQALESRCITHETETLTRTDIPTILPNEFFKEALSLRNKLLLYKLRNYRKETKPDAEFEALQIEPRIKEVLLPLASTIDEPSVKANLKDFAIRYQKNLVRERGLSLAKLILESIIEMHNNNEPLAIGNIASHLWEKLGFDNEEIPTARKVGSIIGRELGLNKERRKVGNGVPIVVIWNQDKIRRLCLKFGVDLTF